jgi:CDP-diacylglycerol--serine O-phosphatidyltransferase
MAIVNISRGDLVTASYFVGLALILDFFDGFTARMLKVSSPIGKDLDSLADMVTFGVVPGYTLYSIIALMTKAGSSVTHAVTIPDTGHNFPGSELLACCGFIITIFSCIRLARFNNDARQSDSFIGVPTPAATMVVMSLPLIFQIDETFYQRLDLINMRSAVLNPYVLVVFSLVLSYLLVMEVPLFALKFKTLGIKGNELRFSFIAASAVLLITLGYVGIPVIIGLYILLSIVNNIFLKPEQ